jgi:hypothetical protein
MAAFGQLNYILANGDIIDRPALIACLSFQQESAQRRPPRGRITVLASLQQAYKSSAHVTGCE